MKENYDASLAQVLKSEGLWSDNPADPGGATMKGITLEVYRAWKRNPYITKEELKAISDADVHDLYKQKYWDVCHCDDLPAGIDYAVFDASVNMGVGRAAKLIQEAANCAPDGIIGQGTLNAIKMQDGKSILDKFAALKEKFYRSLSTFPTFGNGWLNRVASVKTISEEMLG